MKSFLRQLGDLSENITPANADNGKILSMVYSRTGEIKPPVKKRRSFSAMRAAAVFLAMIIVLVLGVGAFNEWNYSDVFGELFKSAETRIPKEIAHTIKPEVRTAANPISGTVNSSEDIEVLGVGGDSMALYLVIEIKAYRSDLSYSLDMYDFTPVATGKSVVAAANGEDFFINYSSSMQILSETRDSVIMAIGFGFENITLNEKGWASFLFYDIRQYSKEEDRRDDMIFFDVLLDYDFSAAKTFEVNKIANMPACIGDGSEWSYKFGESPTIPVLLKTVEITPVVVRYVIEEYEGNIFNNNSVRITFKNGDVMDSRNNTLHGAGGTDDQGYCIYYNHFDTPYDLSEVYSVTIGDIELVLPTSN
jgi:hypothetical protein